MAGCVCGRGMHGRGDAWQGTCIVGGMHGRGMHGRGCTWQGGMSSGGTCMAGRVCM